MYIEHTEQIYGCFRCGELMGDIREEGASTVCDSCGEAAIMTLTNALDVMNEIYLRGDLTLHGEEVYLSGDLK